MNVRLLDVELAGFDVDGWFDPTIADGATGTVSTLLAQRGYAMVGYCSSGHASSPVCQPVLSMAGTPSIPSTSGFCVTATSVQQQPSGVTL